MACLYVKRRTLSEYETLCVVFNFVYPDGARLKIVIIHIFYCKDTYKYYFVM